MIFIGTKNDRFNSLFYTGIIVLILNIIVQLFEYWERIPWFVYTLIAGLGINIYAIRECAIVKNDKEKLSDISSQLLSINFISNCNKTANSPCFAAFRTQKL